MAFLTTNLAKGPGNWSTYHTFSDKRFKVRAGDVLVYSIFLDPKNPEPKGSIDITFAEGGTEFRDMGAKDMEGIRAHGDGLLPAAMGKWLTRRIPMDVATGKTTVAWMVTQESDAEGNYLQFIDNVIVQHADGSNDIVYQEGNPPAAGPTRADGYTKHPSCVKVDAATLENIDKARETVIRLGRQAKVVAEAKNDVSLAKKALERQPDIELAKYIRDAELRIAEIEKLTATEGQIQELLHTVQHALAHAHPEMEKYTGHLVGHAHIDLQWLWEWQEGLVATHDTFRQVIKFMDEFPGFTFSQSSSCLYKSIEETYPDLFKDIQRKVKSGQWELVGGRVCEGDTNLVSPESHIRQLLYGQLYFRERFGRVAKVGWEPDTFGHSLQMPQILKMAGIHSYYFCRGGQGKPLFWWQGLDGTRMLAFDEPASGSFYNSDIGYEQFEEMFNFEKATKGAKDSLIVYGVGNHGGGPTREHILTALGWMKDKNKPRVKFSSATEFFEALRKHDLTKIPVIDDELNPVFEGVYSAQSEIKRLNRHAEYATTSAEAVATVASLFGFKYPRAEFRRNWEDIAWNHHHDTLPGTAIAPTYEKTRTMLERVLADDKDIAQRAMEHLTTRVTPERGGIAVMVFNPCGWARSGKVEVSLVKSGGDVFDPSQGILAIDPDGKATQVMETDSTAHKGEFWASDIPPFGWKCYRIGLPDGLAPQNVTRASGWMDSFQIRGNGTFANVDEQGGYLKDLLADANFKDAVLGRPELHTEVGEGTSAWGIGRIEKVEPCPAVEKQVGNGWVRFRYSIPWSGKKTAESSLTQTFRMERGMAVVDVECDWNALGTYGKEAPMLRLAFQPTPGLSPTAPWKATYEIPFGSIERPINGQEAVALNWADLSNGTTGLGIISDSKSSFRASTEGGQTTLRMALVRSSTYPDPAPNQGKQRWRYAIVPHRGWWRDVNLPRLAYEFQMPLLSATIPQDAKGAQPRTWSLLAVESKDVMVTGIKKAEKSEDLILHMFDSGGQGTKTKVALNAAVNAARFTNFLEDSLEPLQVWSGAFELDFRKFEIKCLKLLPFPNRPRPDRP